MSDRLAANWQQKILEDCERTLGRALRAEERRFVSSRGGYVALEMIGDHVQSLSGRPEELQRYLNSESRSLYRRVLGEAFDRLPPAVRAIHGATTGLRAAGRAEVRRGRRLVSRLIGHWLGIPPAAEAVDLLFEIQVSEHAEEWTRRFGESAMRSRFRAEGEVLYEQFGPTTLAYALEVGDDGLHTRLRGLRFLGVPVPRALHPRMRAVAGQDGELYRFDIEVEMPLIGLLVGYRGHLALPGGATA